MRRAAPALAVLLLSGCSLLPDEEQEGPEATAEKLAEALAAKDLTSVPWAGTAPGPLADLLGSLAEAPVLVGVDGVEQHDDPADTATVTLSWTWDLDGGEWAYDTTAALTRAEGDADGWEVAWAPSLVVPSLVDGETLDTDTLAARRGDILGARGTHLVTARDVLRYGLDKTRVGAGRVESSARRIARALDVDVASYVGAARAAGEKAFVEAIVLRESDARGVPASYRDIPGAVALADTLPLAPTREFAAPILGTVGEATAEVIEGSGGTVEAGDVVGLSGLQARYDDRLRGRPGLVVQAVDADGDERDLREFPPVAGKPLRTTLDEPLQRRAEEILAGAPAADGAAALVALRPSTGAVLVAANGPGTGGVNVATYGQYAPGSTFKLVSSLALLRSGLSPESPVDCPPSVVVDGKRFENYDDYPAAFLGRIPLRRAVAHSCNTAFVGALDRLGPIDNGALAEAAAALGFGVDHDLGFPAYFGQVPPPQGETEAAADLIGQGKVLASPLAMAAVAASIRAGHAVLPTLLLDHEVTQVRPDDPLTPTEAARLRALMRAVVTAGSGSFLGALPGEVGAKTGTAEYGTPAADGSLPTHAWMVATRDDLAVAVLVETGESGSRTAGPLLEAFLRSAR